MVFTIRGNWFDHKFHIMLNTVEEGKTAAIVSYMTIIGTVVAIFMNSEKKNDFTSFHIRQSLGISLSYFILSASNLITYLDNWTISIAFWIFFFVLWLYGFIGALQGQMRPIPVLGDVFQKLFKSL